MTTKAKTITIYSADWCAFCHAAKEYFDQLGLKYEVKDVEKNPEYAKEAFAKSEQMGIPVIIIDDKVIVGFDRRAIDAALVA